MTMPGWRRTARTEVEEGRENEVEVEGGITRKMRRRERGNNGGSGFIQLPTASPATVPGLRVMGLLDVRWDIVGGLSGACWRQF